MLTPCPSKFNSRSHQFGRACRLKARTRMDACTWRVDWDVSVAAFWFNGQNAGSGFPPGPGWRGYKIVSRPQLESTSATVTPVRLHPTDPPTAVPTSLISNPFSPLDQLQSPITTILRLAQLIQSSPCSSQVFPQPPRLCYSPHPPLLCHHGLNTADPHLAAQHSLTSLNKCPRVLSQRLEISFSSSSVSVSEPRTTLA
jgi:hypothetical protein